jgi:predicted DNA-binding transcriptional regulator AlpA
VFRIARNKNQKSQALPGIPETRRPFVETQSPGGIAMTINGPRRMMLEAEVLDIVPISRSTLWRMERAGKFPKSTYISANKRCWYEDQIVEWQNTVNEFQPHRGRGFKKRAATPAQPDPEHAA